MHRLAFGAIGLSFLLILFYYGQLPDRIPIHFDINGTPDSWSEKAMIWVVPIILGATIWLLYAISKSAPENYNYPVEITAENASYYYKKTRFGLALMNLMLSLLTFAITWKIIDIALGNSTKFGGLFVVLILFAVMIPIMVMVYPPYSKTN